jgi:hypothetical protein
MGEPKVTYALFAYQQAAFVRAAVLSALSQDFDDMEILISEDGSSDDTRAEIERALESHPRGSQVVRLYQDKNQGLAACIDALMSRARGSLIVAAAGDDVSLPHRTRKLWEAYAQSPDEVMGVFSNAWVIDREDRRERLFYPESETPFGARATPTEGALQFFSILGAAHAWSRRTFDVFGPMPPGALSEDNVIPFRERLLGRIAYVPEPVVEYRVHGGNWWLGRQELTTDVQIHMARELKQMTQELGIASAFLHDLRRAEELFPQRAGEWAVVRRAAELGLSEREVWVELLKGAALSRKAQLVAQLLAKGLRGHRAARLMATAFVPGLFLRARALRAQWRR